MAGSVEIVQNVFASDGAREGALQAVERTCIQIHAQAVELAPVDLGQLRNSLMWRTSRNENGFNSQPGEQARQRDRLSIRPVEVEGYIGTNLDYGTYQEFGTRFQRAQPYLRPAGEQVRGTPDVDIIRRFGQESMEREFQRRRQRRTVRRV